ncbi:patatin-like phospholipase family protein [Fodinicurvata sediminis]|uniref:patatin-like phospholipase family protein n=1 Tax=Fodinicurvata sediminis TaxID=1121832 RepID=UPI0003B66497|nr:patatin-like phospholipase family protein [Fodinicurvata sediminis]
MVQQQPRKKIDLALQGGGSHGALTWGILDRILEDERLEVSGISGTSAGAMNAVVLAQGFHQGGRDGAREALSAFWQAVSEAARFSPMQNSWWSRLTGNFNLSWSPGYLFFDNLTRLFSPYELNPFDINPLRDLVSSTVDFDQVNACAMPKIFVTATNVRTGQARVFTQPDLSVETIMASACLPSVYQAVEIDGEAYWDGGYIGNPALHPLVDQTDCRDMVIVQINPMIREELPRTGREILNRLNEINFNASLIKDLRAIQILHRLIEAEGLETERYRDMRIHLIHADEELHGLDSSSKLNVEWEFISYLCERGRALAERWLEANYDGLGVRSTFDLDELFDDPLRPIGGPEPSRTSGSAE